jgi:hypothetical protein
VREEASMTKEKSWTVKRLIYVHSGGTKFYEFTVIKDETAASPTTIVCRWGKVSGVVAPNGAGQIKVEIASHLTGNAVLHDLQRTREKRGYAVKNNLAPASVLDSNLEVYLSKHLSRTQAAQVIREMRGEKGDPNIVDEENEAPEWTEPEKPKVPEYSDWGAF